MVDDEIEQIREMAEEGASQKDVEAFFDHALSPDELAAFKDGAKRRRLRRAAAAQEKARKRRAQQEAEEQAVIDGWMEGTNSHWMDAPLSRPRTSTERSRDFRAKGRDIGELPPPENPWRRYVVCKYSLLAFGLEYCMDESPEFKKPLLKRPPSERMKKFVFELQWKILFGGLKHVRWPRGKGKTTWVKIAMIWAAVYGYKFFMVIVEKVKGMAKVVAMEIWKRIRVMPKIAADFPEFAIPMNDVEMTPQRMRTQTYHGKQTDMRQDVSNFHYLKLPTVAGYSNTGAIIAYRGADQALRGINIDSMRPDFIFLDDPQTDEDAKNPTTCDRIEKEINGAVLGSGETDEFISAVMATTPIEPDDISERFADPERHPEWNTETERLVVTFGPKDPMAKFINMYGLDPSAAHLFYVEHRAELEDGVEMMDPEDYKHGVECSAYEHALYLLATKKHQAFFAEYQMQPTKRQGIHKVTVKRIMENVNGVDCCVIPAQCNYGLLAFVDVNDNAGLVWEVDGFGEGRVQAMVVDGSYPPNDRPLFPDGTPDANKPLILAEGMRAVARAIAGTQFVDELGQPVKVDGICFDGGWMTETVATVAAEINAKVLPCIWSKGYSTKEYSLYHHDKAAKIRGLRNGEHCHLWATANGKYLAFCADFFKEDSQMSFLVDPLKPGSSSLYGKEPLVHHRYATEIANEELVAKEKSSKYGSVFTWKMNGPNHRGDTHAGVRAYAAIRRFLDPIEKIVSSDDLTAMARQSKRRTEFVYVE